MSRNSNLIGITGTELRVCRGCLATDARLYDMRLNQLMEAYSTLVHNIPVTDELPHYLCIYCAALLLKCDTFRNKCIDSQAVFINAQSHSLEATIENLRQSDRTTFFTNSIIETIDIIESDSELENNVDSVPKSTDIEKCMHKSIKIELDSDIDEAVDESNVILNTNDKGNSLLRNIIDDHKINKNEERNCKIEPAISNNQTLLNEDLNSDSKAYIVNKDLNPRNGILDHHVNKNEITDIPIDFEYENGSNSDSEEVSIADLKKTKSKTKVTAVTKNEINDTKEDKKDKTENLSTIYNMEDVDLSKEEQLKEIEDRKKSDSYLQAPFKCNLCGKGFMMDETYKNHMLIHGDKYGKYVCEICHCHFMNRSRLNRHKSSHKKRYTCKECGFITKYLSQAKEHFKWHGGVKETCKYCGKEFSGQSSYYSHLKVSHPTSDELVRCEICGESCNGGRGLRLHEKRVHKEMYSPQCCCSGCNTQFYCSDAFKAHQGADGLCITTHKYCVRCGMSFETEQLLKEHDIEQRKPGTCFKCEVCNKNFKGITSYKKHLRTHSSSLISTRESNKDKKRAVCEICGKVLANKHLLKQHHSNKHSEETPFKCTGCPKSFRNAVNLQSHIRTHTGERPYPCSLCPKAFKTYTNMKRHKLVHTGERPHSCDMCGKTFKTKCDAKTHVKTVHMKIPMPPRIRRRNKKTE